MEDADRVRSDFIKGHIERALLLVTAARTNLDRSTTQQWWAEAWRIMTAFQPYYECYRASVPADERVDLQGKMDRLQEDLRQTAQPQAGARQDRRSSQIGLTRLLGT